jgi:riboflavin synthase
MFAGIVAGMGEVAEVRERGDMQFRLRAGIDITDLDVGSSIACSGVCLTVVDKEGRHFLASASAETLRRTSMRTWSVGTMVNLERSLRYGDEVGGHLVSGHVDDVATVTSILPEGASSRFTIRVPEHLARFLAPKGSVAIDGVSLTVNSVQGAEFTANVIPHTLSVTTLGMRRPGDDVNLEVDLLARYVARLLGAAIP